MKKWGFVPLLAVVALTLVVFVAQTLAAPRDKPVPVAMETFSDQFTLDALGGSNSNIVSFSYPEVRHVSLTLAVFAVGIPGPASNDVLVFAGLGSHISQVGESLDTFQLPILVQFDASNWGIHALNNSSSQSINVIYNYTVTFPAAR